MVEVLHISNQGIEFLRVIQVKKQNPLSNIYSNIYKMKTNESCLQLLKMVACAGPSAAQLEDWSNMQSLIAISFGRYLPITIVIIIIINIIIIIIIIIIAIIVNWISVKNPLFQRFNSYFEELRLDTLILDTLDFDTWLFNKKIILTQLSSQKTK